MGYFRLKGTIFDIQRAGSSISISILILAQDTFGNKRSDFCNNPEKFSSYKHVSKTCCQHYCFLIF